MTSGKITIINFSPQLLILIRFLVLKKKVQILSMISFLHTHRINCPARIKNDTYYKIFATYRIEHHFLINTFITINNNHSELIISIISGINITDYHNTFTF